MCLRMVRINYTDAETGENVSRYNVEGTELRSNELYIQIYVFWMKFLIVELLPYISILLLNSIMIVRRVFTALHEHERLHCGQCSAVACLISSAAIPVNNKMPRGRKCR